MSICKSQKQMFNIFLAPVCIRKFIRLIAKLNSSSTLFYFYHLNITTKKYFPEMRTGQQIFYSIVVIIFIWLLFIFFTNPYVSERETKETRQIRKLIQRKEDRFSLKSNVTMKARLPDVIIVGVKKSGTMTLGKKVLFYKE